jgi:polyhydroxybutyrate depolymerase
MLIINGTADPLVPWEGGGVGFAGRRGDVISTTETVAYWRRVNGCTDVAREAVADRDPHDGSTVTIETGTCARAPVVLMRVKGGGHRIPGTEERSHPIIDRLLGRQNHDIEAADVVWGFFTGAPLNPK